MFVNLFLRMLITRMSQKDKNSIRDRVIGVFNDLLKKGNVNNADDFANKCEFSKTSFSEIMNDKRGVPSSLMRKMIVNLNVNPEYIYEGEGKMYLQKDKYMVSPHKKVSLLSRSERKEREESKEADEAVLATKSVPHYDIEATAGNEVIIFEGNAKQYIKEYIQVAAFSDCEMVIDVRGNSMYPKWCAGERVALKRIKDWSVIAYGEAHVIVTAEQIMLKYIDPSNEKKTWILRSENPTHHSFEVPQNKIKHLFIVKGKLVISQM
jgi:phage repressor protein C with HTH and peptisase S24 domain